MRIDRPEDAHSRFAEAFNAADMEALLAMYEPEARLVPQPGQVVGGRAAIRAAVERFLALNWLFVIDHPNGSD